MELLVADFSQAKSDELQMRKPSTLIFGAKLVKALLSPIRDVFSSATKFSI